MYASNLKNIEMKTCISKKQINSFGKANHYNIWVGNAWEKIKENPEMIIKSFKKFGDNNFE